MESILDPGPVKSLAIIPARGGSKRIKGKNLRSFLGKPIIAYAIENAINSNLFKEVMVSTDSLEIATIAKDYGASIPFMRSSENSNDTATTKDVLIEVVNKYLIAGMSFDWICCLYPTAVLVTPEALNNSYLMALDNPEKVLFSAAKYTHPIWRAFGLLPDGSADFFFSDKVARRTQDLPKAWHDAGMFYWMNSQFLSKSLPLLHQGAIAFPLAEMESQDIDNEEDLLLAEAKYRFLRRI